MVRSHHPGTNDDAHSLEEIVDDESTGAKIISPLLEEVLLVSVIAFAFWQPLIGHDYLHNGNVCIVTQYIKKGVSMIDSKAFYMFKPALNSYCDIEDSYWRLFLDLWVRDVVTDSDSVMLLATSFLSAWLFKGALVIACVPVLAAIYGVMFATIAKVEDLIPSNNAPVRVMEKIVKKLNVVDFMVGDGGDAPPMTKRRSRRSMNYVDYVWYEQNRIFRDFTHFFSATAGVLEKMLTWPMYFAFVARSLCMAFHLGPVLNAIFSLISPRTIASHSDWFQGVSHKEYTDRLLHFSTVQAWSSMLAFFGIAGDHAEGTLTLLTSRYLLIPAMGVAALRLLYTYQSWRFMNKWNGGMRAEVRGPCKQGKECQCECVQHVSAEVQDAGPELGNLADAGK